MAKGSSESKNKVVFGVRKLGSPKKSYNKHTPKPKKYRRQGR